MARITLRDASAFTLRNTANWDIEFADSKFNFVANKKFPATNVTYNTHAPIWDEVDTRIGLYALGGITPPQNISLTFLDNDAIQVRRFLEDWLRGKLAEAKYKADAWIAIPPKDMRKYCLGLKVTEYTATGDEASVKQFLVSPKESLNITLEQGQDSAYSNQIELRILGIETDFYSN